MAVSEARLAWPDDSCSLDSSRLFCNSEITFSDSNIWLAHFDWNLILAGEYEYSKNGNELIISANRTELGIYKYELTKE